MRFLRAFGVLVSVFLFLAASVSAQKGKPFTVLAGLKAEDCIPFEERFRFKEFTTGTVFFENGTEIEAKLNYNLMLREMQYLKGKDTLTIANESDIKQIIISGTTFIIDKGYLELVYEGKIKVAEKQYFNLMDVRKKDPYGDIGAGAATNSYGSLHTNNGQYYKLTLNQDRLFQKVSEFFLATPSGSFVPFNRKKAKQLFSQNKKAINAYLKSNKVNFDSRKDIIRFAEFLEYL